MGFNEGCWGLIGLVNTVSASTMDSRVHISRTPINMMIREFMEKMGDLMTIIMQSLMDGIE